MDPRHALGQSGESAAAKWLSARGLRVVGRHYLTRFGEIDLIAIDEKTTVFIEVKTRSKSWSIGALDAITPSKQRKLCRAAMCYIGMNRMIGCDFRFDVVLIESGNIQWFRNAFAPSGKYT